MSSVGCQYGPEAIVLQFGPKRASRSRTRIKGDDAFHDRSGAARHAYDVSEQGWDAGRMHSSPWLCGLFT